MIFGNGDNIRVRVKFLLVCYNNEMKINAITNLEILLYTKVIFQGLWTFLANYHCSNLPEGFTFIFFKFCLKMYWLTRCCRIRIRYQCLRIRHNFILIRNKILYQRLRDPARQYFIITENSTSYNQ